MAFVQILRTVGGDQRSTEKSKIFERNETISKLNSHWYMKFRDAKTQDKNLGVAKTLPTTE